MITFYIISIVVFTLYIGIISFWSGIPPSISETYYVLGGKNKLRASLFTFFCWFTALPLMIFWIDLLSNDLNFIIFIACAALMFVGTAPLFKEEHQKKIHNISAIICFSAAYLWLILYGLNIITMISVILLTLIWIINDNKVFWWEITAFYTIYLILYLMVILNVK